MKTKPAAKTPAKSPYAKQNNQRRERYKKDSTYREEVRKNCRDAYRRTHSVCLRNCLPAMKTQLPLSPKRPVIIGDKVKKIQCVTTESLANMMGYALLIVRRWHMAGKFPKPTLRVKHSPRQMVYTLGQAKRLLTVMGNHQKENQYLRDSHTETLQALRGAMKDF